MENRLTFAAVFVYTLGVLVTGLWVANPTWPSLSPVRIGMLVLVAALWTYYFDRTMVSRIVDLETDDEEDEEGEAGETIGPGKATEPDL